MPTPASLVLGRRCAGDPAAAKAKNELDWQPRITDPAEILGTTRAWPQRRAFDMARAAGQEDAVDA
jgi:hypothetical protein